MTSMIELVERNEVFAETDFAADLTAGGWGRLVLIGCVDARVDPAYVLGLGNGEASVLRNVGGRVTSSTLTALGLLDSVRQSGQGSGPLLLVVLHHTDCALVGLTVFPELLAEYFEIPVGQLDTKSVPDPFGSVLVDVDVLRAHSHAADTFVAGMVYDVTTGRVEIVVPATRLDPA